MERNKNISKLVYHNFFNGDGYIKMQYDMTKADQDGEKIQDKYICADLINPLVCPVLALDIWFVLEVKWLGSTISVFAVDHVGVDAPTNKL